MRQKFIFSDVDGCFINDDQPDYALIKHNLQRAMAKGFTVVLSTAKTAHEIIDLNKFLNLPGPFIIENGAGILFKNKPIVRKQERVPIDEYQLLKLVQNKPRLALLLSLCEADWLFTQMSDEKLCKITGLSIQSAALAKMRYFTEPIYIEELSAHDLKSLKLALRRANLYFVQTSRFLQTSSSKRNHKAAAIAFLVKNFYPATPCMSFAIGDTASDFSMFNFCDQAFFLTDKINRHYPSHWQITPEIKLLGWQMAIEQIILQSDTI